MALPIQIVRLLALGCSVAIRAHASAEQLCRWGRSCVIRWAWLIPSGIWGR